MRSILYCLSFLLVFTTHVFSQSNIYKNEVGFQTDNDGFLATLSDRYYTAGNFFFFNHALTIHATDSSRLRNKILGFELGQKIYNPFTGNIGNPQFIDRPFAGYLYLASSLNLLYKNEGNLKFEVQAGIIGPGSYARQVQLLIHKTFGFYTPVGWQYQIQNNFVLNFSANYNRLLLRGANIDLSFTGTATLGTGLTAANAGPLLRVGIFNNLYNSVSTTSTVSSMAHKSTDLSPGEFFIYYKPLFNAIAYDATIEGGLFEDKPAVNEVVLKKTPTFFSQQIGASYVKNHWIAGLSVIFQQHNVPGMFRTEQWGAINLLYRF